MNDLVMTYRTVFRVLREAGVPLPAEIVVSRSTMARLEHDLSKISMTWAPDNSPVTEIKIEGVVFRPEPISDRAPRMMPETVKSLQP